jgi:hypothetical protein
MLAMQALILSVKCTRQRATMHCSTPFSVGVKHSNKEKMLSTASILLWFVREISQTASQAGYLLRVANQLASGDGSVVYIHIWYC